MNDEQKKEINEIWERTTKMTIVIKKLLNEKKASLLDQVITARKLFSYVLESWQSIIDSAMKDMKEKNDISYMPQITEEYYPLLLQIQKNIKELFGHLLVEEIMFAEVVSKEKYNEQS